MEMTFNRTLMFRTLLLWGVLEIIAALQVRSSSGVPLLFTWLRSLAQPAVFAAEKVGDLARDLSLGTSDLRLVIADNRRLRLELEELKARDLLLQEDLNTLRESSRLAGPSAEFAAAAVVARCVYRDLAGGTMEVRTAEKIEIPRDTPAVSANGLVGRVVRSEGRRHWLQLLTHVAAAVAVQTDDSLVQGLALGTGGDSLTLAYVPRQAALERGAVLVTSGSDGIFPPGIPAVWVVRIRESDDPFLEVVAASSANLRSTRVVLLLPEWSARGRGDDLVTDHRQDSPE
jgi:rod shape-determining protein MreC